MSEPIPASDSRADPGARPEPFSWLTVLGCLVLMAIPLVYRYGYGGL